MQTKILFNLKVKSNKISDTISILKGMGMKLDQGKDNLGNIICSTKIPENDVLQAITLCANISHLDDVEILNIFPKDGPDKKLSRWKRLLPFVPMIATSAATFFMIYSVLGMIGKDTEFWDVLKLAGSPTIVTFLTHLAAFRHLK